MSGHILGGMGVPPMKYFEITRARCPCHGLQTRARCPCHGLQTRARCPCHGLQTRARCPCHNV